MKETTGGPLDMARGPMPPPGLRCGVLVVLLGIAACNGDATTPADPCLSLVPTDHPLKEIGGTGCGSVRVSPYANGGSFAATITVSVVGARASTTYYLQRAPEVGRADGTDGVCQRALSLSPWSSADAAAPSFITFPLPNQDPLVTLTTDATGNGSVDFDFKLAGLAAPIQFDVMFRVLDDLAAPSAAFLSSCFTVSAP